MKEIIIDVTNRCFLTCTLCGTNASVDGEKHLSFEKIKKILNYAKDYTVYLGGGCFFCHPDFRTILEYIKQQKGTRIVVDVPMCSETYECICEYPMNKYNYTISVSLWGIGAVHDRLSNSDGYKRLYDFQEIMYRYQGHASYSFVLSNLILSQQYEMKQFISQLKDDDTVYFHRLMPTGRCTKNELPNEQDLICFMNTVKSHHTLFHHTLISKECTAYTDRLFIDWNGNVFGCGWVGDNKSIGNIDDIELSDIQCKKKYICPLL